MLARRVIRTDDERSAERAPAFVCDARAGDSEVRSVLEGTSFRFLKLSLCCFGAGGTVGARSSGWSVGHRLRCKGNAIDA